MVVSSTQCIFDDDDDNDDNNPEMEDNSYGLLYVHVIVQHLSLILF